MVVLQKLSRPHFDKNSYFYTVFFRLGFEKKWTTISFRWFKYNKKHELFINMNNQLQTESRWTECQINTHFFHSTSLS